MNRELFKQFNDQANYNLGVKGNLSQVLVAGLNLAKGMGKEKIAVEKISSLPPAEALNNKDPRLDSLVSMYTQDMVVEESRVR